MQVHYTRLFTDESGASRFEDLTIELRQGFSAPGLETSIFSAPFLVARVASGLAPRARGMTRDYTKPRAV
jgi:hypothetical protein